MTQKQVGLIGGPASALKPASAALLGIEKGAPLTASPARRRTFALSLNCLSAPPYRATGHLLSLCSWRQMRIEVKFKTAAILSLLLYLSPYMLMGGVSLSYSKMGKCDDLRRRKNCACIFEKKYHLES